MSYDYKIITGNCLEKLKELEDNSIDAIVTDPPYELGFMGKKWDNTGVAYNVELWKECLRVLKHGGHLLSFGGTRTYHRMTCAIEDAGFEIRDCVFWTYGSGFPKSLNIGKAYDKLKGNDREVIGSKKGQGNIPNDRGNWGLKPNEDVVVDKGTSEWEGWGTALKPAVEPICMARKPLKEKTIVENVIKWGVGGINIDESRVGTDIITNNINDFSNQHGNKFGNGMPIKKLGESQVVGRFPANLIWTHHPDCRETDELILNKGQKAGNRTRTFGNEEEVISGGEGSGGSMNEPDTYEKKWECVAGCPSKEFEKAGVSFGGKRNNLVIRQEDSSSYGGKAGNINTRKEHNDTGTPARFFKSFSYEQEDLDYAPFYYCAKASKSERNEGCENIYNYEGVDKKWLKEKLNQLQKVTLEDMTNVLEEQEWNTIWNGKEYTEKFQEDIKSIIKMVIKLITELKIWNFSQHWNIRDFIQVATKIQMEYGLNLVESVENIKSLQNTMNEKMELVLGVNLVVLEMLLKIKEKERKGNTHSTVKPLKLCEYLIKMVTPKGGVVLDPFMGSGTTGCACVKNGIKFIGIEMTEEYIPIAEARIKAHMPTQQKLEGIE